MKQNRPTSSSFLGVCLLLCLLAIGAGEVCFAQSVGTLEHLNVEDGLSQYTVFCIAQDSDGFMWFGTKDGLNRFDGRHFKVYRHIPGDSTSLGSNYILSLCMDKEGNLWIGTDNGLYRYDRRFDCFSRMMNQAEDGASVEERVNGMLTDDKGRLWIAADGQGVFCFDPINELIWHYPLRHQVQCIERKDSVSFWVGASPDIYIINEPATDQPETSFSKVPVTGKSLDGCTIRALLAGKEMLYIATYEQGMLVLQDGEISSLKCAGHSFDGQAIRTLERKNENEIFIGENRLFCLDETSGIVTPFGIPSSEGTGLSDFTVYSIFKDRENGIWLGTYYDGVIHLPYNFTPFRQYLPQPGKPAISGERTRELCPDNMGHLWIGSEDGGLSCLDLTTDQFVSFPIHRKGIDPKLTNVHGLAFDGNNLWIGYYNGGFDQYDIATGEISYRTLSGLMGWNVNEDIFALCVSSDKKKLWIGTVAGVYSYDIAAGNLTLHPELGKNFVYDIQEDSNGCLWIATFDAGAFFFDPESGRISQFRSDEQNPGSIPSDKVISIFISSQNEVWLTTEGGGICRYLAKSRSFERFDQARGLPNNVAYKIVGGNDGMLWFGTNNGLVSLNPSDGSVKTYTRNDGLTSNLFNYKSGYLHDTGRFYFGTVKGLISFNPSEFSENTFCPTVALTRFALWGEEKGIGNGSPLTQSVNTLSSITLAPNETTFSFEFALLSYSSFRQHHFEYMLEGADKGWTSIQGSNRVSFTNLRHGDYVFHLRGINENGQLSSNEKKVHIRVMPPFYLTRLAFVLYVLAFLVLLTLFIWGIRRRYANRQREQMEYLEKKKEKEVVEAKISFFTSVVHEIRTPLTLISAPLEYILSKEELSRTIQSDLLSMKRNTDRLIQLSNQLLDFRSVESKERKLSFAATDISQLLESGWERIRPLAESRNLQLTLESASVTALADSEALVKIISNLLGNAVKFAATFIRAELSADTENSLMRLTVCNDGEVIPEKSREHLFEPFFKVERQTEGIATGTGLGLSLASELARMHDGELSYSVTPFNANLFTLTIPLRNASQAEESSPKTLHDVVLREQSPDESRNTAKGKPVVLLVEDNSELLEFLTRWLANSYEVLCANNGVEALRIIEENDADIIVSDIMMPEMDGITLLKKLKEDARFSHIPVVMLTAKNTLSSKIESLNLGADAYVEKPFSCTYLQAQMDNLLEKHRYIKRLFSLYPMEAINSTELNDTDQQFWSRLNSILDNHLDNPDLDIDMISSELGMSRSTLKRKFDTISELTPNEYIRLYRLKKAASYLKENKYRINEIIDMTGFGSSSYFAKCFKKQFGVLPKDYIQQDGN